jgi:sec-independent protein translocase protein TatA
VPFSPPADLFGEQGLIVLIVVAVVLFGSTQIPKLARSLGSAQKEFKKGLDEGAKGDGSETQSLAEASPPPAVQAPPAAQPQAAAPAPPTVDGTPGANP